MYPAADYTSGMYDVAEPDAAGGGGDDFDHASVASFALRDVDDDAKTVSYWDNDASKQAVVRAIAPYDAQEATELSFLEGYVENPAYRFVTFRANPSFSQPLTRSPEHLLLTHAGS